MQTAKRDIYQEVTNRIIAALEEGVSPWSCPWDRSQADIMPINHSTGDGYRGINVLLLWLTQCFNGYRASRWMTYKQAAEKGGQVKKNEHGTLLVFYKPMEKKTGDYDPDGNEIVERFPLIRSFTVFNLDQIDGIEWEETQRDSVFEPIEAAESVLNGCGVKIHHGGNQAFYRPSTDEITLPVKSRFHTPYDYYATAMHELIHATGHPSRCDRKPYPSNVSQGARAMEELTAEVGSAITMAALGLNGEVQDHAAYLDSWLAVLKEDKKAIFKASAEAQKAHEWIAARMGILQYPQAA